MSQDVLDRRAPFGAGLFGPASVVAVAIGISLSFAPWLTDIPGGWWWSIGWPLLGVVALPVRGVVRQAGVGTLASALTWPVWWLFFGVLGLF
ncbi:hypothetical protein [Nocardioides sp. AE5]|uniref:hypothetical protein n=1 Tax=Nocardioides sp. AE5 TaxID=2962573 RepID=UPI0028829E1B|nr:hypothetical protein [Nocardioides sp. AE5]MDT0200898.1 hypothetical protein [Nocardioides sp. AE5]